MIVWVAMILAFIAALTTTFAVGMFARLIWAAVDALDNLGEWQKLNAVILLGAGSVTFLTCVYFIVIGTWAGGIIK